MLGSEHLIWWYRRARRVACGGRSFLGEFLLARRLRCRRLRAVAFCLGDEDGLRGPRQLAWSKTTWVAPLLVGLQRVRNKQLNRDCQQRRLGWPGGEGFQRGPCQHGGWRGPRARAAPRPTAGPRGARQAPAAPAVHLGRLRRHHGRCSCIDHPARALARQGRHLIAQLVAEREQFIGQRLRACLAIDGTAAHLLGKGEGGGLQASWISMRDRTRFRALSLKAPSASTSCNGVAAPPPAAAPPPMAGASAPKSTPKQRIVA